MYPLVLPYATPLQSHFAMASNRIAAGGDAPVATRGAVVLAVRAEGKKS